MLVVIKKHVFRHVRNSVFDVDYSEVLGYQLVNQGSKSFISNSRLPASINLHSELFVQRSIFMVNGGKLSNRSTQAMSCVNHTISWVLFDHVVHSLYKVFLQKNIIGIFKSLVNSRDPAIQLKLNQMEPSIICFVDDILCSSYAQNYSLSLLVDSNESQHQRTLLRLLVIDCFDELESSVESRILSCVFPNFIGIYAELHHVSSQSFFIDDAIGGLYLLLQISESIGHLYSIKIQLQYIRKSKKDMMYTGRQWLIE